MTTWLILLMALGLMLWSRSIKSPEPPPLYRPPKKLELTKEQEDRLWILVAREGARRKWLAKGSDQKRIGELYETAFEMLKSDIEYGYIEMPPLLIEG